MAHDKIDQAAEQAAILAAFPTRSGRHDLYAEARRFVSERHEKSELIALVTWLLYREEQAKAEVTELKAICRDSVEVICGFDPSVGTAGCLLERMRKAGVL